MFISDFSNLNLPSLVNVATSCQFYRSFQKTNFQFIDFLYYFPSLRFIAILTFIISFLPSGFFQFLQLHSQVIDSDLISLLRYVLTAVHFPLHSAFAAFHKFCFVVFLFSFISAYFLISFVVSFLILGYLRLCYLIFTYL